MIWTTPNPTRVALQITALEASGEPKLDVVSGTVRVYHVTGAGEVVDLAATPLARVGVTSTWRYAWVPASLAAAQYVIEYTLVDAGATYVSVEDLVVSDAAADALVAYGAATAADVTTSEAVITGAIAAVPAATDVVLTGAHGAGAWDGTAPPQVIRDAMLLAPTPGVPAAGSVDAHLDAIDAKTVNLPTDPADQSAVEAAVTAAVAPLAQQGTLIAVQAVLEIVRKVETGRWRLVNNQMIFYDDDGLTPLLTFDLFDDAGVASMATVFERRRVP